MLNEIKNEATTRMQKSIDALKTELVKLRTGRANAALLDHVRVDYYGSTVPISQAAQVTVEDSRTISIQAWDKAMVTAIEKAIMTSDLGLNPNTAGQIIRIIMPPLTEQRRKEIARQVKATGEEHKVAIRNERRDANEKLKTLLKDKVISEDDKKRAEEKVQKETDAGIAQVDQVVAAKEKEVLEV